MPTGSVSELIQRLQDGDASAVRSLWGLYFPRLVALARSALDGRQQALVRLVRQFIDPSLHRGIRGLFYDPLCNIKESSNPHADRGSDRELCWQFHSYARHTTTPAVSGR
jgi:hypothetical protein